MDPINHPSQVAMPNWTIMVYLAGDNNLERFAFKDLGEMKCAGSTSRMAIVAQLDGLSNQSTRRYFLQKDTDLSQDCVARLPEVNTGDPAALADFIEWATNTFPARHYGLILWNHGAGWKDDDVYQAARKAGQSDKGVDRIIARAGISRSRRALFRPTMEKVVDGHLRAVLFDDTSADFLDNIELKKVMQQAVKRLGRPIDLLGFDACLMSMLEVQYQVRSQCHLMVASQEIEPADGWPYGHILIKLACDPDMNVSDLGRLIVKEYIDSYRLKPSFTEVTLSAVYGERLEPLAVAVSRLADVLRDGLVRPENWSIPVDELISSVQRQAIHFRDQDYFDLADICRQLYNLVPTGLAGQAAESVLTLLKESNSPVAAAGTLGAKMESACGISIYLPSRALSPLYQNLDFGREQTWGYFLQYLIPTAKAGL